MSSKNETTEIVIPTWFVIVAPIVFTLVAFGLAVLAKDIVWLAAPLTAITGLFLTISLFAIVWSIVDPAGIRSDLN